MRDTMSDEEEEDDAPVEAEPVDGMTCILSVLSTCA